MSKRKVIIGIVLCLIIIGIVLTLVFLKRKPETLTLYGEYSQIETTNKNVAYQKSYLMMDCCEEWPKLYKDMLTINDALAIEGYEIYLFDENGKKTDGKNTFTFIPTDDFKKHTEEHNKDFGGRYDIYHWTEEGGLSLISEDNNSFKITSEDQGIFVIAFIKNKEKKQPFVSNPECDGQCRACEELY